MKTAEPLKSTISRVEDDLHCQKFHAQVDPAILYY